MVSPTLQSSSPSTAIRKQIQSVRQQRAEMRDGDRELRL